MPNRLQQELSPYLLQHAENPVDWYPWCDEALQKAKQEDRPIFLSIGYSACHWCHVMEHESFESARIASMLNENFVSIKVDREERPDLDQLYMSAVMALRGGGGGWPLSVFLTPDQEVFFGGTYWPPESRMGMPGFDHVLTRVLHAYRENREQVDGQSAQMTKWLEEQSVGSQPSSDEGSTELSWETLRSAATSLRDSFDFQNGGFGSAPKFPHAMDLGLLLRMANNHAFLEELKPEQRAELLEMVELNLKKMAYGGIFDHLAGGFARYSVDERWLVPHFEKMLYDNALLSTSYMETFRFTRNPFYSMVGRKTLDYLLNEMASPQGGYFSAEDADSEGVEGKFYVWQKAEIIEHLGDEIGNRFCQLYNVTEAGNFEGANILNMTRSYREWADSFGMEKDTLRSEMRSARQQLLEARSHRVRPGLDDKILCSWNALAITAMCEGTLATGEKRFVESAERAFDFIWTQMREPDGQLLRVWRQGQAKQPGFLDDYAYLIDAVYSLYRATFNERYVDCGAELVKQMIDQFSDQAPGFFFTSKKGEQLIARTKDQQDNSIPSGNSMAATALLKWGRLCGQTDWIEKAWQTIQYTSSLMNRAPLATGQMLIALENYLTPSEEWVLLAPSQADLKPLLEELNQTWRPNVSLIVRTSETDAKSELIDGVLDGKGMEAGEPTLYVCRQFSCQAPIVGKDAIIQQIRRTIITQNT